MLLGHGLPIPNVVAVLHEIHSLAIAHGDVQDVMEPQHDSAESDRRYAAWIDPDGRDAHPFAWYHPYIVENRRISEKEVWNERTQGSPDGHNHVTGTDAGID
jgi:hypothetical protein